ncbi:MAG: glutathione peroxidase [Bacteroidia bacterium]
MRSLLSLLLFLVMMSTSFTHAQTPKKMFHDLSFSSIDGETVKLSQFKGKKVLLVNTASRCGYTPQYKQLQELHEKFGKKVVVIGFPCNDFGGQEPGDAESIASFCEKNYGVDFIMADKVSIKGSSPHPIYQWLTQKSLNGQADANVRWNFHKFLVDEEGRLMGDFPSSVSPTAAEITGKL